MYHVVTHEDQDPEIANNSDVAADEDGSGEPSDKKERVLHTRIPAVLEAELKATARALRVPVSNLVRTILEDAIAIADRASERVEDRLSRAAEAVRDERGKLRQKVAKKGSLDGVVAYQPVVIAADGDCAKCGRTLREGDDASLAITTNPGPPRFVCRHCMPRR